MRGKGHFPTWLMGISIVATPKKSDTELVQKIKMRNISQSIFNLILLCVLKLNIVERDTQPHIHYSITFNSYGKGEIWQEPQCSLVCVRTKKMRC